MKPIAYLMVERNIKGRYIQTNTPTREEKISHEPYEIYHLEDIECQYCENGCIRCDARKSLTDEEIISEWIGNDRNYYNFARAILKKASEK